MKMVSKKLRLFKNFISLFIMLTAFLSIPATASWAADITPPSISGLAPQYNSTITPVLQATVTDTESEVTQDNIKFCIDGNAIGVSASSFSGGIATYTPTLAEGTHTLYVKATDNAGNLAISTLLTFYVDTAAPTVTTLTPQYAKTTSVTLTNNAVDPVSGLSQVMYSNETCSDDFNDGVLNTAKWTDTSASGGTIAETGGSVTGTTTTALWGVARLQNNATLTGDFDAQVDFDASSWTGNPSSDSWNVELRIDVGSNNFRVNYRKYPAGSNPEKVYDVFSNLTGTSYINDVGTTDTAGKLRLVRTGDNLDCYYFNNSSNSWSKLYTFSSASGNATLKAYVYNRSSGNAISAKLDNLITWNPWETYSATKSYTLSSGNGQKPLWAQFKDKAGNISNLYQSIFLDTVAPTAPAWAYDGTGADLSSFYPTPAPTGLWSMNNNWNDTSGSNYNGSAYGGPTFTTSAKLGSHAGSFNGSTAYVDLPGLPVDTTTANAKTTVEFWMYWNGSENQMPFGWSWYDLYFNNGYFGFNTGNSDIYGIPSTGLANRWVHVAAVFNNGSVTGTSLYIDGQLQTLTQQGTPVNRNVNGYGRISSWRSNTSYKFGGKIDELAIYNRALTQTEVTAHYNNGAGIEIQGAYTPIVAANWASSTDATSGLNRYEYAIGTTSGGTDVINWTSAGNVSNMSQVVTLATTGKPLVNGTTYYVSVRAVDNAGNISGVTTTNGQLCNNTDTTPPTATSLTPSSASTNPVTLTNNASDTGGSGLGWMSYASENSSDDFTAANGSAPNGSRWSIMGPGTANIQGNSLYASSINQADTGVTGQGKMLLIGDFDIQVDFSNFSLASGSFGALTMRVWEGSYYISVERRHEFSSKICSEIYTGSYIYNDASYSGTSGTLRITRTGTTYKTYYYNNGWQLLRSQTVGTGAPAYVNLYARNNGSSNISGKFDNFISWNPGVTLSDSFNESYDPTKWTPGNWGAGVTPNIVNGKMSLKVNSGASGGWSELKTKQTYSGDFDVQVDFTMPAFTANTEYTRVELAASDSSSWNNYFIVSRETGNGYNQYMAVSSGWTWRGSTATTDTSGKFRITRIGSTWTAYKNSGSGWTQVGQWTGGYTGPVNIYLQSINSGTWPAVEAQFDNFSISNWNTWEPYSTTKSMSFSGDGQKPVYARFMDNAGNISNHVYDPLVFDSGSPIVTGLGPQHSNSITPTLSANVTDAGGIDKSNIKFCVDGDSVGVSASSFNSGVATYTPTLADGTHTFYIKATDNLGNVTTSSTLTFTVDTVTPAVSSLTPQYTNVNPVTLTNNASDPLSGLAQMSYSNETYSDDFKNGVMDAKWITQGIGDYTTENNGALNINLPITANTNSGYQSAQTIAGDFDIQVDFSNFNCGGTGYGIAYLQFNIDSSNWLRSIRFRRDAAGENKFQGASNINGVQEYPEALTTATSGKLRITRTGSTAAAYYDTGSGWQLLKQWTGFSTAPGTLKVFASVNSGTSLTTTFDNLIFWNPWESYSATKNYTLSAGDGQKLVYARFKDNAGNVSSIYNPIILDTAAPAISNINPANGSTASTDSLVQATLTDTRSGINKNTIVLKVDGTAKDLSLIDNYYDSATGVFSYPVTFSAGTHDLYLEVKDNAGNQVTTSTWNINVISGSAPTITVNFPTTGQTLNIADFDIQATLNDSDGTIDKNTIVLKIDGAVQNLDPIDNYYTSGVGAFSYPSVLSEGTHNLYLEVQDNTGIKTTTQAWTVTVDTIGPVVTGLAPQYSKDLKPTFTANVSDATSGVNQSNIKFHIDGDATGVAAATYSNGVASYTPDANLSAGTHTLEIKATDNAGNLPTSSTLTFYIDQTGPTVSGLAPQYTNSLRPTFSVNVSDSSSGVTRGNIWFSIDSAYPGNAAATYENGVATYTRTSDLSVGSHTLVVKAYDNAGNLTTSSTLTFYVDLTAPTVTSLTPPYTKNNPVTLTNNAADNGGGSGLAQMRYGTDTYSDDFTGDSGDVPNSSRWSTFGPGTVQIKSNSLYVSSINQGNTGVSSSGKMTVSGDFDIQVDFSNFQMSGTGVFGAITMTLQENSNFVNIERRRVSGQDQILTENVVGGWNGNSVNYADTSGKLRITRVGTSYSSYYYNNGWQLLHSKNIGNGSPVYVVLNARNDNQNVNVSGNFDNLILWDPNAITWSPWEPYSATKSLTLSAGAGPKSVSAQFKDNAGNISNTFHNTILLDTTGPSISNLAPQYTTSTKPTLSANVSDDSGVTQSNIKFFIDGDPTGKVATTYSGGVATYTFPWPDPWLVPDMIHTLVIEATDNAGNVTSSSTFSIYVDQIAPLVTSLTPQYTTTNPVTLTNNAIDFHSGLAQMIYSNETYSDDFEDGVLNTSKWTNTSSAGATFTETGGSITGTTTTANGNTASLQNTGTFTGDFDIQLDFDASYLWQNWDHYGETGIDLNIAGTTFKYYYSNTYDGFKGWSNASGFNTSSIYDNPYLYIGKIRISRTGSNTSTPTLTLYYNTGNEWSRHYSYTSAAVKGNATASAYIANRSSFGYAISAKITNFIFFDPWEAYSATKNYTLSAGDGQKSVYANFKDNCGNISKTIYNPVLFDATPPVVTGLSPQYTSSLTPTLSANVSDANIAQSNIKFHIDGDPVGVSASTFSGGVATYTPTLSAGSHTLVVKATDNTGNTTTSSTLTFYVDPTAPTVTSLTPQYTKTNPITLTNNAADTISGLAGMRYSNESISDDFNDGILDTAKWTNNSTAGGTISETAGSVAGTSTTDTWSNAKLQSTSTFSGDFDAQFDFDAASWTGTPSSDAWDTSLQFSVGSKYYKTMYRKNPDGSKTYWSYSNDAGFSSPTVVTSDTTGKIRLVRTGSNVDFYYLNSSTNSWTKLYSFSSTAVNGNATLQAMITNRTSGNAISAKIDNFIVWTPSVLEAYSDDFNDNAMDAKWSSYGTSTYTTESGGALNVNIPVNPSTYSGYASSQTLSGDFDIQVDFSNFTYSGTDYGKTFLYFATDSDLLCVERTRKDAAPAENKFQGYTKINGTNDTSLVNTTATSGKMRITRTGSTVATYYDTGSGWQLIKQWTGFSTAPGTIRLYGKVFTDAAVATTFDNLIVNSSWEPYNTTKSLTLSSGDGQKPLWAQFKDYAGNLSNAIYNPITLDTVGPTININNPVNGGFATENTTLQATLADPTSGINSSTIVFNIDGSPVSNPTNYYNSATGIFSYPATLSLGSHNLYLEVEDNAGNKTTTAAWTFTVVENAAPAITVISPTHGQYINTTNPTVQATLSDSDGSIDSSTIVFKIDGVSQNLIPIENYYNSGTGAFSYPSTMSAGTHNLYLEAQDNMGVKTTVSAWTVTIDTTPPTISGLAPQNANTLTPALSANVSDAVGIDPANIKFYVDSDLIGMPAETYSGGMATYSPTLAAGQHTFYVKATDKAGNTTTSSTMTLNVDIAAPSVTSLTPQYTNNTSVTLTNNATDPLPSLTLNFSDDFSDGIMGSKWSIFAQSAYVAETGGSLNINVPSSANNYGGYQSAQTISGDFDIQVDFNNFTYSGTDAGRAVFKVGIDSSNYILVRRNRQDSTSVNNFEGEALINGVVDSSSANTTSTSGKMRITRTGSTAAVYYDTGAGWQLIKQWTGFSANPGTLYLFGRAFTDAGMSVNYDNLILWTNSGLAQMSYSNETYSDDFNNGAMDAKWSTYNNAAYKSESGGSLNINIPANANTYSGYQSSQTLSGDFDIQVDFSNFTYSGTNTGVAYLYFYVDANNCIRTSRFRNNSLGDNFQGAAWLGGTVDSLNIPTTATSGKFRITRTGSTVASYYDSGSGWQLIKQWTGFSTNPGYIQVYGRTLSDAAMSVNFDNLIAWTPWEAYSATKSYTLSSGDGQKYVWARFKDYAGNFSNPVYNPIVLDTVAPSVSGLAPSITGNLKPTFSANVSDTLSGVSQNNIKFLIDADPTGVDASTYVGGVATYTPASNLTTGAHTLKVKATDNAGNVTTSATFNFTIDLAYVDSTPPTVTSLTPQYTSNNPVTLTNNASDAGGSGLSAMAYASETSSDAFTGANGSAPKSSLWSTWGPGTVNIQNNSLYVSSVNQAATGVTSTTLTGDFDIQVDFSNFLRSSGSFGALTMEVWEGSKVAKIERRKNNTSDTIYTESNVASYWQGNYDYYSGTSGSLRITRTGNTYNTLYYNNGWKLLSTYTGGTGASVYVNLYARNDFQTANISGNFDNFIIWPNPTLDAFSDDFNGSLDTTNKWNTGVWGSGVTPTIVNGKVSTKVNSGGASDSGSELSTKQQISGDFDVEVDFTLPTFTGTSYARIDLGATDNSAWNNYFLMTIETGKYYHAVSTGWTNRGLSYTSDTSGKLKITRSGSTWTSYKNSGSGWEKIGEWTNGYTGPVYLYLQALNSVSRPAVEAQFDNFTVRKGWEEYSPTKNWTLPSADGQYSVYARFKDNAGNISNHVYDPIVLDTVAPTVDVLVPHYFNTLTPTLTANVSDTGGISQSNIKFLVDADTIGVTAPTYSGGVATYTPTLAAGIHTLVVKATDNTGHVTTSSPYTFYVDTAAPTVTTLTPQYTTTNPVTLTNNASDTISGLAGMRYSNEAYSDDFNDSVMGAKWTPYGNDPYTTETGGTLKINIPYPAEITNSGYISTNTLSGDFDIQVDLSNFTYSGSNNGRALLEFYIDDNNRCRTIRIRNDSTTLNSFRGVAQIGGVWNTTDVSTTATSGKLRITRTGSTVTSYYDTGSGWQLIRRTEGFSTAPGKIRLLGVPDNGVNFTATFDNLIVWNVSPSPWKAYSDDFNNNVMDSSKWNTYGGNAAYTSESGGALNFNIPNNANTNSGYISSYTLPGDFDVQVDFNNFTYSGTDYGKLVLYFMVDNNNTLYTVRNRKDATAENNFQGTSVINGVNNTTYANTTATSGKMRITRTGSTVATYYDSGSGWQLINQSTGFSTAAGTIRLYARGTTDAAVSANIDNLNVMIPWEDYNTTKEYTLSSGNGQKLVYAQFMDNAGNISNYVYDPIVLDSTEASITGLAPQYTNSLKPTFSANIVPGGITKNNIKFLIDGDTTGVEASTYSDGKATYTPSANLTEGSHTLVVKATDNTGHTYTSETLDFIIDRNAPAITAVTPANSSDITYNPTTSIQATLTDTGGSNFDYSGITLKINNVTKTISASHFNADDGSFNYPASLALGANQLSLTVQDRAGNKTSYNWTVTVEDNSGPVITDKSPTGNIMNNKPTISAKASDPSGIASATMTISGYNSGNPFAVTVDQHGNISFTVPTALDNGTHTVTLDVTDNSANHYVTHETWTFNVALSDGPHGDYSRDTSLCFACHITHEGKGGKLMAGATTVNEACNLCHDGIQSILDVKSEISGMVSHHGLNTGVQDCSDCHNPHLKNSDTPNLLSAGSAHISSGNAYCGVCHGEGSTKPGGDITTDFAGTAHNVKMANGVSGNSVEVGENIVCLRCHTQHGSPLENLLKTTISANNKVSSTVTGNDATVCYACHGDNLRQFGGKATWSQSLHGTVASSTKALVSQPGESNTVNLCLACHNPHGTGNSNYLLSTGKTLCLNCHKDSGTHDGQTIAIPASYSYQGATAYNNSGHGNATASQVTLQYTPTGANFEAWSSSSLPKPPAAGSPGTPASSGQLDKISSNDTDRWATGLVTADGTYNYQMYKFHVDYATANISNLTVKWIGYGEPATGYETELFVWNNTTSTWEQQAHQVIGNEGYLTSPVLSSGIAKYLNGSGDVYVMAKAKHDGTYPIISNVSVSNIANGSATVEWDTYNKPSTSTVLYNLANPDGSDPGVYPWSQTLPLNPDGTEQFGTHHNVVLSSLIPEQKYYYKVSSGDVSGNVSYSSPASSFTTDTGGGGSAFNTEQASPRLLAALPEKTFTPENHYSLNTNYVYLQVTANDSNVGGGCTNCHTPHGNSNYSAMVTGPEDAVCFGGGTGCHSDAANSALNVNIQGKFTAGTSVLSRHNVSEVEQAEGGTKVLCTNCHDPHIDNAANKIIDPDNPATSLSIYDGGVLSKYIGSGNEVYLLIDNQHKASSTKALTTTSIKVTTTTFQGSQSYNPVTGWQTYGTNPTPTSPPAGPVSNPSGMVTNLATADYQTNIQMYKFVINKTGILSLAGGWQGTGENATGYFTRLYIWNFTTNAWVTADTVQQYSVSTTQRPLSVYMAATVSSYCNKCHDNDAPAGVALGSLANISDSYANDYHGSGSGTGNWAVKQYQSGEPTTTYPQPPFKRSQPSLGCQECHDTHGSSNIYHLKESVNGNSTCVGLLQDVEPYGNGVLPPIDTTKIGDNGKVTDFCKGCHSAGGPSEWHYQCLQCHKVNHSGYNNFMLRVGRNNDDSAAADFKRPCLACHYHGGYVTPHRSDDPFWTSIQSQGCTPGLAATHCSVYDGSKYVFEPMDQSFKTF